jgi:UDP-N-acetylglucosamine 3-dehydrogenase
VGGYPNEPGRGNNVLVDLAVHDVDVLHLLEGKMRVVASACHSTVKRGVLDTAEIMLRSPRNGPSASIHVNWITPTKIRTLRVTGTGGVGIVDYMLQTCTIFGGDLVGPRLYPGSSFEQLVQAYQGNDRIEFGVKKVEPLRNELEDFARYVRGFPHTSCTGSEALYSLEIAEEIFNNV